MHSLQRKQIKQFSGISLFLLRSWEKAGGVYSMGFSKSYDPQRMVTVLHLSALHYAGMKVKTLITCSPNDLKALFHQHCLRLHDAFLWQCALLEASLNADDAAAQRYFTEAFTGMGFLKSFKEVLLPALLKVAVLKKDTTKEFLPELLLNRIIKQQIQNAIQEWPAPKPASLEIVLITMQYPVAETRLLFVHYLLRKGGWNSLYIGALENKSFWEILCSLPHSKWLMLYLPDVALQSEAEMIIEKIVQLLPERKIAVFGPGVYKVKRLFVNLMLLPTDAAIENFALQHHNGET